MKRYDVSDGGVVRNHPQGRHVDADLAEAEIKRLQTEIERLNALLQAAQEPVADYPHWSDQPEADERA